MNQSPKINLAYLFQFAGNKKFFIYISCFFSALSSAATLLPYVCVYYAIREVFIVLPNIQNVNMIELLKYGKYAVIFAILGMLLYLVALMCSHYVAFHVQKNLKLSALQHLLTLPLGYFDMNPTGKLRKIIDENAASTESYIAHQVPDTISSFVAPIMMLLLLAVFDWRLGTISILVLLSSFVIQFSLMNEDAKESLREYQNALEDMGTEAVEYVRGISVVKVFSQTVHSFKTFKESILRYSKASMDYTRSCKRPMVLFLTLVNSIFFFLMPAVILISPTTKDYRSFILSFIFYIVFTPACAGILNKIMYSSSYKSIALESLRRIDAILQEKPLAEPETPQHPEHHTIVAEEISFTYPNAELPAIDALSLKIPQHQTTALVGPSGSGKSTLSTLIPRFWDVAKGSITLDGISVKEIHSSELLGHIAIVFQNTKLFKDTIRNNILFSRPDASEKDLENAISAAQCQDIIEKFPQGLNTVIGTQGIYLSDGEQQRISLARAILKDAPIIILDEATAFADAENEHKIQKAFQELTKKKTVLLIAHRLSTVKNADQIAVIKDGKVAEQGVHSELLEQEGIYYTMWEEYKKSISWTIGTEGNHAS